MMRGGSIVDATFIEARAPRRTGPRTRSRGAPVQEGKNWHFGYKAHIGVDAGSGLGAYRGDDRRKRVRRVHGACPREGGRRVLPCGPGYTGVAKRPEVASDPHLSSMRWTVAEALHHKGPDCTLSAEKGIESREGIRPLQVEHPFLIVKRRFGHLRTRWGDREEFLHALRILRPRELRPWASPQAGPSPPGPKLPERLRSASAACVRRRQGGRGKAASPGRTGALPPCPAASALAAGLPRCWKGINHRFPRLST